MSSIHICFVRRKLFRMKEGNAAGWQPAEIFCNSCSTSGIKQHYCSHCYTLLGHAPHSAVLSQPGHAESRPSKARRGAPTKVLMTASLTARGYNLSEINKITGNMSHDDRSNMNYKWQNKPPFVFTTTYNPCLNHGDLNQAINKYWFLIQYNETLSRIFQNPPFVAYKKKETKTYGK